MEKLSRHDKAFQDFALNGKMGTLMLRVCLPLTLYQSLNQLFRMLDTMLASMISASTVTTVAYLSTISTMLSALGAGLAVGASMKVSEAFGAKNYDLVRTRVSTLVAMCAVLSLGLLGICVPFAPQVLRLFGAPQPLIDQGRAYFVLELIGMVISFFNSVYLAVERARGNSGRIFWLNIGVTLVKLALSAVFVLGWEAMGFGKPTIELLSVASLVSQCVILAAAVFYLSRRDSVFSFSFRAISFRRRVVGPMLGLSLPIIVEKFAFSYGRVLVNAMCAGEGLQYHPDTVGATSVSNRISGITITPQNGFQEGGSAIISQNLGAKKPERALEAFQYMLGIDLLVAFVLVVISLVVLGPLSLLAASGDREFAGMIATVYRYEAIAVVPLALHSAVMGLLYGIGKTRLTLVMNFCRVFVFRVPVLYALQHFTRMGQTDGPNTIGACLALSNTLCGILAGVIAFVEIRKLCKAHGLHFWKR